MGYVNRELNKPSQSRSGLAEAALAQLKSLTGQQLDPTQGLMQPGMGAPSPVGTPPMSQRQLTVTPTGKHVFLDMVPNNAMSSPIAQAAQAMLVNAPAGPLGMVGA